MRGSHFFVPTVTFKPLKLESCNYAPNFEKVGSILLSARPSVCPGSRKDTC